ncbi:uncharacterized protein LOC106647548 [Copidosoma floridanum]|uniref:uncharacterized protein LOC106647548 n=1 Tax=Copidosoma floridanum TaxID=29053 RepID=UPI0006C9CE17|nr:uncharacterized protein LOC106647548 [Copidosoma floridanum]
MSHKKVWNSILRRRKKNRLVLDNESGDSSGSVSPLLRRASRTASKQGSGSQQRHTFDIERIDPDQLPIQQSELKSLSLPRGFLPELTEHVEQGESLLFLYLGLTVLYAGKMTNNQSSREIGRKCRLL